MRDFWNISYVYIGEGYNDNGVKERVKICGGFDE